MIVVSELKTWTPRSPASLVVAKNSVEVMITKESACPSSVTLTVAGLGSSNPAAASSHQSHEETGSEGS